MPSADSNKTYHNAVFVGLDEHGVSRHGPTNIEIDRSEAKEWNDEPASLTYKNDEQEMPMKMG